MTSKRETGEAAYRRMHWGNPATHVFDWEDPDYPKRLIAFDHLVELHFQPPGATHDKILHIGKQYIGGSWLAFDKDHKHDRLYVCIPEPVRRAVRRQFWSPDARSYTLRRVAQAAPGCHATDDYPRVSVQPLGVLTHVVYLTDKKGDNLSNYIHEFGEVNGKRPILAVDSTGRLWFAGGDYTCPTEGITN